MDTAAPVDRMVDCFNRHDPEALATCDAPDARVHPAGWPQRSTPGPGWPPFPSSSPPFPTFGSTRATWPPTTGCTPGSQDDRHQHRPVPLSETERLLLGT